MHTLANVRTFLDTLFISDADQAETIQIGLTEAADERDLLTAMKIHNVLGQDLASRYFAWFGKQAWPDRTSQKRTDRASSPS